MHHNDASALKPFDFPNEFQSKSAELHRCIPLKKTTAAYLFRMVHYDHTHASRNMAFDRLV